MTVCHQHDATTHRHSICDTSNDFSHHSILACQRLLRELTFLMNIGTNLTIYFASLAVPLTYNASRKRKNCFVSYSGLIAFLSSDTLLMPASPPKVSPQDLVRSESAPLLSDEQSSSRDILYGSTPPPRQSDVADGGEAGLPSKRRFPLQQILLLAFMRMASPIAYSQILPVSSLVPQEFWPETKMRYAYIVYERGTQPSICCTGLSSAHGWLVCR